ncbi:MAG TPA: Uma2 family endonuclease [Chloroflexota bacterium]|nr:Uma2 family endonuclease [Chloroflexota bacterium]
MVAEPRRWTVEEYLWLERTSEVKHEFVDGIVYAQAGGTRAHSRIAINAGVLLDEALADTPCRVFNSDMKIRITPRLYRYPDLAVSCHPADTSIEGEDLDYISFPTVVIEVLSDSTDGADRTEKFDEYRTITTLREYVLVESMRKAVHVHRHAETGTWPTVTYLAGQDIILESLDVRVPVDALYRKVLLPDNSGDGGTDARQ